MIFDKDEVWENAFNFQYQFQFLIVKTVSKSSVLTSNTRVFPLQLSNQYIYIH